MRPDIVPGYCSSAGRRSRSWASTCAVLARCRPDWDIGSAELRAGWANGEKARFFPYGKTAAQFFAEQD